MNKKDKWTERQLDRKIDGQKDRDQKDRDQKDRQIGI